MVVSCISIYLFIGVILLSFMFVYSFLRSKSSYAKALGALSLTIQLYLLGYLLEINTDTLKEMLFWNQIQYLGVPFFPAIWLTVSMLYTGKQKYLSGFRGLAVFAIPLVTFIIRLTNDWHHLYYSKITLQQYEGFHPMLLTKGPWYIVHICYVLIALVLSNWFYFQRYRQSSGDEKVQFRLLFLASVLPYLALILNTVNIGYTGIDYSALILPPCILLINIALTSYNFLEIKILAREKVYEDSEIGMILLNHLGRVVDYNASSTQFLDWFGVQIKEERLEVLLKEQQELLDSIKYAQDKIVHCMVGEIDRYLKINVRGIQYKEEIVGQLVTLIDVTEIEVLKFRLIENAATDELSGLKNRRNFRECAQDAYEHAHHYHEQLAVLMMDIDYFKIINDTFGHLVGDTVIREFAVILSTIFGETNIIGRIGGEEFAVVMLNTDANNAFIKAEYFRKTVEETNMMIGQKIAVTVSIGVAEYDENTLDLDELLNRADHAMYEAKHRGRNCTVVDEGKEQS